MVLVNNFLVLTFVCGTLVNAYTNLIHLSARYSVAAQSQNTRRHGNYLFYPGPTLIPTPANSPRRLSPFGIPPDDVLAPGFSDISVASYGPESSSTTSQGATTTNTPSSTQAPAHKSPSQTQSISSATQSQQRSASPTNPARQAIRTQPTNQIFSTFPPLTTQFTNQVFSTVPLPSTDTATIPVGTLSSGSTALSTSLTSFTSPASTSPATSSHKRSDVRLITGCVISGVVFLLLLLGLLIFLRRSSHASQARAATGAQTQLPQLPLIRRILRFISGRGVQIAPFHIPEMHQPTRGFSRLPDGKLSNVARPSREATQGTGGNNNPALGQLDQYGTPSIPESAQSTLFGGAYGQSTRATSEQQSSINYAGTAQESSTFFGDGILSPEGSLPVQPGFASRLNS